MILSSFKDGEPLPYLPPSLPPSLQSFHVHIARGARVPLDVIHNSLPPSLPPSLAYLQSFNIHITRRAHVPLDVVDGVQRSLRFFVQTDEDWREGGREEGREGGREGGRY